jgi:hypothetical protein
VSKRRRPAAGRRIAEQRFWGIASTGSGGANGNGQRTDDGADGDGPSAGSQAADGQAADRLHSDRQQLAGPESGAVQLIRPTTDPAAVVRSLGPTPLAIDAAVAERHLTAVYEEAVRAAIALAAANGLLAAENEEETGGD